MRVTGRLVVLSILAALAIDFAMLERGAFQFNIGESLAMRAEARLEASRGEVQDLAPARTVDPGTPMKPRIVGAAVGVPRPMPPAARSRLIVAADGSRSAEDH